MLTVFRKKKHNCKEQHDLKFPKNPKLLKSIWPLRLACWSVIWYSLCFTWRDGKGRRNAKYPRSMAQYKQQSAVVVVAKWGLRSVCSDSFASEHLALLLLARCAVAWRPLLSASVKEKNKIPCWDLRAIKPGWESLRDDASLSSASIRFVTSVSNNCCFPYNCLRQISCPAVSCSQGRS